MTVPIRNPSAGKVSIFGHNMAHEKEPWAFGQFSWQLKSQSVTGILSMPMPLCLCLIGFGYRSAFGEVAFLLGVLSASGANFCLRPVGCLPPSGSLVGAFGCIKKFV